VKPRSPEDSAILTRGELWESFKKTEWFNDMVDFSTDKLEELRDRIIQASTERDYELARDLAQQLSGFKTFLDYIDSSISTREDNLKEEYELKEFGRQLPHRL
jgi:chromosome condensin MukBEF ATPase and DNA-binding subunit MukB